MFKGWWVCFNYMDVMAIISNYFKCKMSVRDYIKGVRDLNLFLKLFTIYYQTIRMGGG